MIDLKVGLLAVTAVGATGALGVGALCAHGEGGFHGRAGHAMMEKFVDFTLDEKLDEIQATDQQKQRIHEIKDRLVREGEALHEDREAVGKEIVTLLAQDQPDADRVRALVRQRTAAFTRFGDDVAQAALEVHGLLTPDQRSRVRADLREHLEHHWH